MIIDILFVVIGTLLRIIALILGGIQIFIPQGFYTAIEQFLSYAGYLQGLLPIYPVSSMTGLAHDYGIMTLLGYALSIYMNLMLLKMLFLILRLTPFLKFQAHHSDIMQK